MKDLGNTEFKVPKKYEERLDHLWREDGLSDDCKYILYLADGWQAWADGENSFPVKSKKEALEIIKEAYYKEY